MWQYNRLGLTFLMLAFFIFVMVPPTMSAETPNPTACDGDGSSVRKGRPGIAPLRSEMALAPQKSWYVQGSIQLRLNPPEKYQRKTNDIYAWHCHLSKTLSLDTPTKIIAIIIAL